MNPLELQKYFDPLKLSQLIRDRKYATGFDAAEKVATKYKLNPEHLSMISAGAAWNVKTGQHRYEQRESFQGEIEMLYWLLQKEPSLTRGEILRTAFLHFKANSFEIKLSDKVNLTNLLIMAWPHIMTVIKQELRQYVARYHRNPTKRKIKGAKTGQAERIQDFAIQVLNYLDGETDLIRKEKGDVILSVYKIAGHPLKYKTGKTAYDSLSKARATRMG